MDAASAMPGLHDAPISRAFRPMGLMRRLGALLLIALLVMSGLIGCASASPEEAISSKLASDLDKVKNHDGEFISDVASYMDVDRFNDYGIDSMAFVTAYFDGFDYTIDSIDVDGETAQAQVTLTCKSYSDFHDRLSAASDAMVDKADDYVSMSREDIARVYGGLLMETLGQVGLAPTKPLSFTFTLTDSTWQMQENLESAIASSLLTN